MGTKTRGIAVALAAMGLFVAAGCAKDETVTTAPTTAPVTAKSNDAGSDTTEDSTPADDEDADKEPGSYDEACSIIEEIDGSDFEDDYDAAVDLMTEARDAFPEDLADHWDTLIDAFEEIGSYEPDSDEQIDATLDLLDDQDFLEAAAAIDDFAEEECGLDIDLDPAEESGVPGGRPGDDEVGAPSDGSEDATSIRAIKAYMADNYDSEVWWPVLDDASGWSMSGTVDPTLTITLSASSDWDTLTTAELEAACDAVADHLDTVIDSDAAVEILDPDEGDLVSRYFRGEACGPDEGF